MKKATEFSACVDGFSNSIIENEIKAIASPEKTFIGKNVKNNDRHSAKIYFGTDEIAAVVSDGFVHDANKKLSVRPTQNGANAVVYKMEQMKELVEKFPETQFAYTVSGIVQMTTMKVTLKNPCEITYRPKARVFKDIGVKGDISSTYKIENMKYSFCPEYQSEGLKIKITKK
jgi:hypothetical protein